MNIKDILNSDMETIGRLIRQALAWWLDELLALVPHEWRARLVQRPKLIVDWDERGLSSREGNVSKPFDPASHTSHELDNATIVLPMSRVLTRELDLPLLPPNDNPLSYFRAVMLEGAKPDALSSLETNVTVVEILDAARRSAESGKTIRLPASR